jgi:hypothetical protein
VLAVQAAPRNPFGEALLEPVPNPWGQPGDSVFILSMLI